MNQEPTQTRADEVREKLARLRSELERSKHDAFVLSGQSAVAWITAGLEDPVIRGADPGLVWVLVNAERAVLITQNVEGPRIRAEEPLEDLGFEVAEFPWHEGSYEATVGDFCDPGKVGSDQPGLGAKASW